MPLCVQVLTGQPFDCQRRDVRFECLPVVARRIALEVFLFLDVRIARIHGDLVKLAGELADGFVQLGGNAVYAALPEEEQGVLEGLGLRRPGGHR